MKKQVSIFANNFKFLRERKKITQEILGLALNISRSKIAAFETGLSKSPSMEDVLVISDYFQLPIDLLFREDLRSYSESKLVEIETSIDYARGKNIRIITITVDSKGKENIEYVPIKVKAGYLAGYNDPEFIKELPKASLPFLSHGKTMRLFDCEGESMFPLPNKCKILGEYVDDWHDIKDGGTYIVISQNGYALKNVYKKLHNNSITLKSLNPLFVDYDVYLKEVLEIWKYVLHITDQRLETLLPMSEDNLKVS